MAAVTARLSAFWGAFLHLLLTCVTGLGFEAPARLRAAATSASAARTATTAGAVVPAPAAVFPATPEGGQGALPVCVPAQPGAVPERRRVAVPARAATVPPQAAVTEEPALDVAPRVVRPAAATPYQRAYVPAPRPYERERSLPPTMKQRIGAEAHGTSPSARSVAVPADGLTGLLAEASTGGSAEAFIPAARRRDRALCS